MSGLRRAWGWLSLHVAATGGAVVRVLDCAQRSQAWRLARCGVFTASNGHRMLARGRDGVEAVGRRVYRRQLFEEILSGIPAPEGYVSAAMIRGRQREPEARAAYARHTGLVVETSGFVLHDELRAGCSLDGHVGAFQGVIEIKAPGLARHTFYRVTRRIPGRYRAQITHQLWITGAAWCDFVSYHPSAPLVVIRFPREAVDVAGYARAAAAFLADVDQQVAAAAPVMAFFRSAPLDVARQVLERCVETVNARRLAPRAMPVRAPWQPALGLSGRTT